MKKLSLLGLLLSVVVSCSTIEIPPKGVNYETKMYNSDDVQFHYDLSYLDKDGNIAYDTNIWNSTYNLIDESQQFLIIEMFLYNDMYNRINGAFPEFSSNYTKRLIDNQNNKPNLKTYMLLDENNTQYGIYEPEYIKDMKKSNINVTIVDIFKLKDTFPWYSPLWRTLIEPLGNPQNKGWIPNFYGDKFPKLTIRNVLRALNVKADHRKVFLNENRVIVPSANIHDPSYYHGNTALESTGCIVEGVLENMKQIARFSNNNIDVDSQQCNEITKDTEYKVQFISENKVGKSLDNDISSLKRGDSVIIGMYFLADKKTIENLENAANRGVDIKIILDRNKDAFGMDTKGLPNKPVAKKILKNSNNKIKIKWYLTNGEQYHSKFIKITKSNGDVIVNAGSANFIRKNIRGYIMDANLRVVTNNESQLNKVVDDYFNRLWDNKDGLFTIDYGDEPTTPDYRDILFEVQDNLQIGAF